MSGKDARVMPSSLPAGDAGDGWFCEYCGQHHTSNGEVNCLKRVIKRLQGTEADIDALAKVAYETFAKGLFGTNPERVIVNQKESGHTRQDVPVLYEQVPEAIKMRWRAVVRALFTVRAAVKVT